MAEIGTVISFGETPSSSEVRFVIKAGKVHKGQFVEIEHEEGPMLALVEEVYKTNRYYEHPETVKEFESSGKSLEELFPVKEWEYLVGIARPLAIWKDRPERPTYPPSPGAKVYEASPEKIKTFVGFSEDGLYLGTLLHHPVEVKIGLSRLLQKHLAILAMSGAGKSYLTSVLIEELLDRTKEQGRIAVVVFDVHGEYIGFAKPAPEGYKDYSAKTKWIRSEEIKIGVPLLSANILAAFIPRMSAAQRRELSRILSELREEMHIAGPFGLETLRQKIATDRSLPDNTRKTLLSWISNLEATGLFDKIEYPPITEFVRPGMLTIFDLSGLIDLRQKQMIVTYFLSRMFAARRRGDIPPFLAVIEEAHQFAPEKESIENAISRPIIETIAREGRKFGAALCLISQRPIKLSATALSQCNTHIILRVTNPYDLKHIGESSEQIDRRCLDMISTLRVGEALITGSAVNFPVFFKVRRRRSLESPHEVPMEVAARRFEEQLEKRGEEVELFL